MATFRAILRKFGLLFSSISGHTRLSLIEVSDYLPSPQISINKIDKALPASACGLPLISKVMTSIGLIFQLYRNANMNFVVHVIGIFNLVPVLNQYMSSLYLRLIYTATKSRCFCVKLAGFMKR